MGWMRRGNVTRVTTLLAPWSSRNSIRLWAQSGRERETDRDRERQRDRERERWWWWCLITADVDETDFPTHHTLIRWRPHSSESDRSSISRGRCVKTTALEDLLNPYNCKPTRSICSCFFSWLKIYYSRSISCGVPLGFVLSFSPSPSPTPAASIFSSMLVLKVDLASIDRSFRTDQRYRGAIATIWKSRRSSYVDNQWLSRFREIDRFVDLYFNNRSTL